MNKLELLIPGQFYHIFNRGNNKENIFFENKNYVYFLRLYEKYIYSIADTYAYCLLKNHFHFLLKIKEEELLPERFKLDNKKLSIPFSNFFNSYSKSINSMYKRTGSLFQERFKRKSITSDKYLMEVIFYIHSNPQKHKLIKDYREYHYSSYKSFLSEKKSKLARTEALDLFGGIENFINFHEDMSLISNYSIDLSEKADFI